MNINVAIEQSQIYDDDFKALLSLQNNEPYCDNIITLETDNGMPLYMFENSTLATIVTIFEQAPYLELTWNADALKNTGELLDITLIFFINEGWLEG